MKKISILLITAAILFGCNASKISTTKQQSIVETKESTGEDNIAYKWGKMALIAQSNDTEKFKPRPTVTPRYLGLIFVAVIDAWFMYDETATPVYLEGVNRRPAKEQTLNNKEIAISYAAFRAMNEYYYSDYARPYALVHQYYDEQKIKVWGGEGKGMIDMDGIDWIPYSPEIFLCPPFPSYTSGHSSISGGCAEALKMWTGSEEFGSEATMVAGALTEPDNLGDTITLKFPTFTETAGMAGISRVLGGYHIQAEQITLLA